MKFPGVVAVLCVVPSGLVLHIGITLCTFPPWAEMSRKNRYELVCMNFSSQIIKFSELAFNKNYFTSDPHRNTANPLSFA